jgi:hypothetical protein
MTWLTVRQFRIPGLVVAAAVAVLGIALAITGPILAHLAATRGDNFLGALAVNDPQQAVYYIGAAVVLVLPAVIGVFWGAPLVARELDSGTYRLVWNQSVTRTRWLATKLGLLGLAAVIVTAAAALGLTWWAQPIDAAVAAGQSGRFLPRIEPSIFAARGVAPIGYAALALVLGTALGAVLRRTVPAMAVTLALLVAVQVTVPLWVRPHLLAPEVITTDITAENFQGFYGSGPDAPPDALDVDFGIAGAWQLANETVDRTGAVVALPGIPGTCAPSAAADPRGCMTSYANTLSGLGYRQRLTYQPDSRFWSLQFRETALYLALAMLLATAAAYRIRRVS